MSAARNSSATATTGIAEPPRGYCGRFAPSPTGPLHFGSLVAAIGSFLEARTRGGRWLVRIEDLDPPREQPGASGRILADLERFGFQWDGPVLYQSSRAAAYESALTRLRELGLTRECGCTRSLLAALPANREQPASEELFHPPECVRAPGAEGATVRFRAVDRTVEFDDGCQGRISGNVAHSVGDFILRRRDGLHAYQLAVVVDDAEQGVTDVVRGADLLASTPRQILLQAGLGLAQPHYLHLPLAVDASGTKLSKSGDAPAMAKASPSMQLATALASLRQDPPPGLATAGVAEVWQWAARNWRPERFRGIRTITAGGNPPATLRKAGNDDD